LYISWLEWRLGDSLGISGSSDAPRKLCSVRKRSVSGKCFICAKAKRQRQQSAQSERKSTTRYGD